MPAKAKAKRIRVKQPPATVPLLEVVSEIEFRLKHSKSARQKLRDSCHLSHAALETAKIDELEYLLEWLKRFK